LGHSDHPENIAKYIRELIMKTGRRGTTTDVELNARKLLGLKVSDLKVFIAYCVKCVTVDERANPIVPELEYLTGLQKDAVSRASASLKDKRWLVHLKKMPNGTYIEHPDQTGSESGGHADFHHPQTPYKEKSCARSVLRVFPEGC
jgi:hypothetical protein